MSEVPITVEKAKPSKTPSVNVNHLIANKDPDVDKEETNLVDDSYSIKHILIGTILGLSIFYLGYRFLIKPYLITAAPKAVQKVRENFEKTPNKVFVSKSK